jgi:hypothetical protein
VRDLSLFNEKVNIGAQRRHRREVWVQILLPLALAVALGIVGLVALLNANTGNVTRASQLATILLALPLLVMGIIFVVVLVAAIYALGVAMKWIPTKTVYVHRLMERVNHVAQRTANLAAQPVIALESWSSALARTLKKLR